MTGSVDRSLDAATLEPLPLRGRLLHAEPMARHTSWRVGGPAERFYIPADLADLTVFVRRLPAAEPVLFIGLGSNLLVRDGGLQGTVISTGGALSGLSRLAGPRVRVEAGVACPKLARFCNREGLRGAEFLAGIPGTMGGALAMNAGACGTETWTRVEMVETLDRSGELRLRPVADFEIGYRHVRGPEEEWFVAAHLRLEAGDAVEGAALMKQWLARRGATQPTQQANAGSVFRNPPGDHAGRLVEAAGLKGLCVGGACVSDKHANFIVNTGAATAADIEVLIEQVAARVEQVHGIRLQPEVRIVGRPAAAGGQA